MLKLEELYHKGHTFYMYHKDTSFKLTTDSVLVADFIKLTKKDNRLVDFGTGLGTILLLVAARSTISMIGLELDSETAAIARETVKYNHLENQIQIITTRIQDVSNYIANNSIDVVISNPPYFKVYEASPLNSTRTKMVARHEIEITFEELVQSANKILKEHGRFVFIHRVDRMIEILEILKKYKFEPKRMRMIHDTKEQGAVLFLMEATKQGKSGLKIEAPLILKEG